MIINKTQIPAITIVVVSSEIFEYFSYENETFLLQQQHSAVVDMKNILVLHPLRRKKKLK